MDASVDELVALDARHVWHPYASMPARFPPLPVAGAEGVRIRLADGRELVDGMASWWAAIHGYRHPVLDAAVREQLDSMAHVMFGGLTHEPAVRLAERLAGMVPGPLQHVFFADSGSVAIEVAAKMCLQYWQGIGQPRRTRFLSVRGGYHGDTFMAMSLSDPTTGMHHLFEGTMPTQVFADRPPPGVQEPPDVDYVRHLESMFDAHGDTLAGVVIEPVVQGAGGMHFYAPSYVRTISDLCDRHDTLLVVDEIATGFGRTGELFAINHAGVEPDVMCVGKALTGGYMTLAATLCTNAVAEGVGAGGAKALMHGPTYMANPLACAVALGNLSLLDRGDWRAQVKTIGAKLSDGLAPARQVPHVRNVRVFGGIGVIELDHDVDMRNATAAAVDHGVWLRPFGKLIYAMPPYVANDDDLDRIAKAMVVAATCA